MQDQSQSVNGIIVGRPLWKTVLIIGAITFVSLFIVSYFAIRSFSSGGPKRISVLPESFPESFVVYRPEIVKEMYLYSAKDKAKPLALITAPLKMFGAKNPAMSQLSQKMEQGTKSYINYDTVTIVWKDVDASVDDVMRFFAGALIGAGVSDPQVRKTDDGTVYQMIGSGSLLEGDVLIVDRPDVDGVDSITCTIAYPAAKE